MTAPQDAAATSTNPAATSQLRSAKATPITPHCCADLATERGSHQQEGAERADLARHLGGRGERAPQVRRGGALEAEDVDELVGEVTAGPLRDDRRVDDEQRHERGERLAGERNRAVEPLQR